MNTQTLTTEAAADLGRMAWHTGMNEAQLCAIFRTLGFAERAEVSRHGVRAFRHIAIDLDNDSPGEVAITPPEKPSPTRPNAALDGPTLIVWRERMGYSQAEAAKMLGCSRNSLAGWETGQRIPHYIGLACAALALGMTAYGNEGVV
jgi:DNA-binding XRE family transcriptional regulator